MVKKSNYKGVYPNQVHIYLQYGRISEPVSGMNELNAIFVPKSWVIEKRWLLNKEGMK